MARFSLSGSARRRAAADAGVRRAAEAVLAALGDRERVLVAVAGPPGAGKSTLAEGLRADLSERGHAVKVVPMDGYHFDNAVLDARGLRARKGAPETFDLAGFAALVARLARCEPDVAIPVFDRAADLARAGADVVATDTRIVLVEGNYLLLDETGWRDLAAVFDLTIYLDVPTGELERRLVRRWLHHGHDEPAALARARGNDIPNAMRVVGNRIAADLVITDGV